MLSPDGFDLFAQNDLLYVPERVKEIMRYRALNETYYLAYNIMGFDKLRVETHGPLCKFLDTCTLKRRIVQHPRSTFKTTLVTVVGNTQTYLRDDTEQILIVGNSDTNARKHLSKIRIQFERNRLLRFLFPERFWEDVSQASEWSGKALFCPTKALHGEPTFDCAGAGSAIVSRHYTKITADDIIGDDEAYSDVEMDHITEWSTGLESFFIPPFEERQLDIPCTYWRTNDVYAFLEKFHGHGVEPVPTGPFSYMRGNLAVFRRGAIEDGKSIYPEGLPMEFLQRLQETNPERYAAQYANNPMSSDLTTFRPEYRRWYDQRSEDGWVLSYKHLEEGGKGEVEIIRAENLYRIGLCDPHAGGSEGRRFKSSRASVMMVGVDTAKQRIFILDCWIKRAATNEIVDEILRQNEKWHPEIFSIEANGLQKMLKHWIDERVERDYRPSVPYDPYIPTGDKDGQYRIKGLQPLYRAGQIYHGRGMLELEEEYLSYPRGLKDGLDCLAQGLKHWNVGWDSVRQDEMEEWEQQLMGMRNVATGY